MAASELRIKRVKEATNTDMMRILSQGHREKHYLSFIRNRVFADITTAVKVISVAKNYACIFILHVFNDDFRHTFWF